MTSAINPNNIDGAYPIAGQPNNTQGMRDNFTATKTNFQYAADEITDLQSKVVVKSALTGGTLNNNMNDNLIYAVKLNDVSYTYLQNTATAGTVTVDYSAGQFQYITTTGSVSLSFANWPVAGDAGSIDIAVNITNTAYTLTLPAAVSLGTTGVQGYSANVITFAATGTYQFRFFTTDSGTTITIFDLNRPLLAAEGQTIGYQGAAGTGGTVTQATNKATGVTLNKPVGQITLNNASLAAATTVNFTLTNSYIGNTDLLILNQTSTANAGGYYFNAICNAGNAQVSVRNIMAASASDAVVLRYAVVKGEIA
jgi:hypothetical protein